MHVLFSPYCIYTYSTYYHSFPLNWKKLIEKLHSAQGFTIKTKSNESELSNQCERENRNALQLGKFSVFVLLDLPEGI